MALLIPQIFHQIWVGTKPMPQEFLSYRQTWLYHHPDWEMRLWTDETMPPLTNQVLYDRMHILSQKADIASFELLYRFGGVYIDTDFECYKNIEALLDGVEAFAASEAPGIISHGIMGATAGHPSFSMLINGLADWINSHADEPPNVQTGPVYITNVLSGQPDFVVYAPAFFYPYSWRERFRKGKRFPYAYAAHHWAASWHQPH